MRFVRGLRDPPPDLDLDGLREVFSIDEVALAVVFGSYAAGDHGPLSDLDVAIKYQESVPRDRRLELLDTLTVGVTDAAGIEAVDLVDIDKVGPRLGHEIFVNGLLIYGDPSDAIELETNLLLRKLDFQPVKRAWDEALDERIENGTYGRT